jgi:membrane-associated phospholipid phosphatase
MLFTKITIVKLLKKHIFEKNGRPTQAVDCNILNQGGPVGGQPGFPSGHSAMAVSLFIFILIQWYIHKEKHQKVRSKTVPNLVIITGIFAILVPIARVNMKCHTVEQVQGGIVVGIVLGILFAVVIDPILHQSFERYRIDKESIFSRLF